MVADRKKNQEEQQRCCLFLRLATLRCCFCQNSVLKQRPYGKELTVHELGDAFLRLQDKRRLQYQLVTPPSFQILSTGSGRHKLHIPVVCNCGGYERPKIISQLKIILISGFLILKYFDNEQLSLFKSKITLNRPLLLSPR